MRHSRSRLSFAFVMVFAVLLLLLAIIRTVDAVGLAVIAVLAAGITLWVARAPAATSDEADDEAP